MVTPSQVFQAVAQAFGVERTFIISQKRCMSLAYPRFAAWKLARTHCPFISLVELGTISGMRDHGTIIHGVRRANDLLATDINFQSCFAEALTNLTKPKNGNETEV